MIYHGILVQLLFLTPPNKHCTFVPNVAQVKGRHVNTYRVSMSTDMARSDVTDHQGLP